MSRKSAGWKSGATEMAPENTRHASALVPLLSSAMRSRSSARTPLGGDGGLACSVTGWTGAGTMPMPLGAGAGGVAGADRDTVTGEAGWRRRPAM